MYIKKILVLALTLLSVGFANGQDTKGKVDAEKPITNQPVAFEINAGEVTKKLNDKNKKAGVVRDDVNAQKSARAESLRAEKAKLAAERSEKAAKLRAEKQKQKAIADAQRKELAAKKAEENALLQAQKTEEKALLQAKRVEEKALADAQRKELAAKKAEENVLLQAKRDEERVKIDSMKAVEQARAEKVKAEKNALLATQRTQQKEALSVQKTEQEALRAQKKANADALKETRIARSTKAPKENKVAKKQQVSVEKEVIPAVKLVPATEVASTPVVEKANKEKVVKEKTVREKSVPDSANYRKILGVKFNKNVDYKSSINYFEDKDSYALLEKGVSFVSFNLGLASFQMDNKWIEPLVKIDDTYYTQFFAKASGGYFIANNTALALKVSYGFYDNRIKLNSDVLQLLINAKTYETNNVGTDVAVSAVVRNYIPIGIAQRFFVVTETAIGYKYSESLQRNIYDEGARISKVENRSHMGMLGISPGVSYFMTKGFAFEFMLSPIQVYYKNSRSINNEVANGSSNSYGLSFAFTPLNIQLGFCYYFGLDYKKNHDYMSKFYKRNGR